MAQASCALKDTENKHSGRRVRTSWPPWLHHVPRQEIHPNTTEHHIRWIQLFFKPQGDKYPYQVGSFEFTAHGESVEGPNKGPVYTNHTVVAELKVSKPGTLVAASFCNIHGLWENSKDLQLG
jgi:superoxide reductase